MKTLVSNYEVYLNLRNLMANQDLTAVDLSKVLSNNPYLTSSLLAIVNTAFFGIHGKIDCINRTIQLLGIGQTYELVSDLCHMNSPELNVSLLQASQANDDLTKMAWSSSKNFV